MSLHPRFDLEEWRRRAPLEPAKPRPWWLRGLPAREPAEDSDGRIASPKDIAFVEQVRRRLAGVTGCTSGTSGGRPAGTALEVGASLIAQWADGKVPVTTMALMVSQAGYWPVKIVFQHLGDSGIVARAWLTLHIQ